MAKGVTKPKSQQRSIASFFASPPPKRKAPDAVSDATEAAAAAAEKANDDDDNAATPAAAKKSKVTQSPVKQTPIKQTPVDDEDEPEADDVEMKAAVAPAAIKDDDDDEEEEPPVAATKPGRRRLRQRVHVSDASDDDDDVEFAVATNAPSTGRRSSSSSRSRSSRDAPIDVDDDDDDGDEEEDDEVDETTTTLEQTIDVSVTDTEIVTSEISKLEDEDDALGTTTLVETADAIATTTPVKAAKSAVKTTAATPVKAGVEDDVKPERKVASTPAKPAAASGFFAARTDAPSVKPTNAAAAAASTTTAATAAAASDTTDQASTASCTTTSTSTTIPYASLAHLFNTIEATSSRLAIQELLLQFFRDVIRRAPQDLLACLYLCVCTDLAPPFENLKIGIGDAILMKAIGEATGTNLKFIKDMYQKEGDLGKVAQNARSKQHTLSFAPSSSSSTASKTPVALGVQDVYDQFVKIAKMTGNNSQAQKCSLIKSLLVKCEKDRKAVGKTTTTSQIAAEGAKYIIRGLQGKLRIGLAEKSILIGLTYAFMREKDASDKDKQQRALAHVKKAFAECPSYTALVAAFIDVQRDAPTAPLLRVSDFGSVADRCVLTPGTPVSPMLARPTKAYAMVFDRFEGLPFTCEYKYDGERAQIHIVATPNAKGDDIAIFSRNFENSTERFPDVMVAIKAATKKNAITSCIVDAEVVAIDKATNKRLPFQILSTRSRKNVKIEDIKVPVCIYAFDLLYLNGESYLTKPLAERREKLQTMFELTPGVFELATSIDVAATASNIKDDAEAMEVAVDTVRTFLEEAVRENCEGLMVKTLEKEATYEPANRSHKWLKLKKDYLDGIGDSVDLVPIGAFYGRGKRTGVYGAYLLACYDPETEMYQPITKLGTGLSDEVLKTFYEQLKAHVVDKTPQDYATVDAIKPDVWFAPTCVWEILGADLSISPKYTAAMGLVANDKGISLRFPRFIRIRDDKNTTDATTSTQIADLYRAQGLATVSGAGDDDEDDMLI